MIHFVIDGGLLRIFRHGVHRPSRDAFLVKHDVPPGHYEAVNGWNDGGAWMQLRPLTARDVSALRMDGWAIGARARWRGGRIDLAGIALPPARGTHVIFLGAVPDDGFDCRVFFSVR